MARATIHKLCMRDRKLQHTKYIRNTASKFAEARSVLSGRDVCSLRALQMLKIIRHARIVLSNDDASRSVEAWGKPEESLVTLELTKPPSLDHSSPESLKSEHNNCIIVVLFH